MKLKLVLYIIALAGAGLVSSCNKCKDTFEECNLQGKWNIVSIDGREKAWGNMEVYHDLSGGRINLDVPDTLHIEAPFGGGYFSTNKSLSVWNLKFKVFGNEGYSSQDFYFDEFVNEDRIVMRITHITHDAGNGATWPLSKNAVWVLERQ